jgi:acyl-CoA thioesterase-1
MRTVYTFGDSILDCARYNDERVDPAGLLVANRDDLFPEFRSDDLWTRDNGLVRLERWARDGSTIDDLPFEDTRGLESDGPAIALITIGGNDLIMGLLDDDGPGIPAFARKLTGFLDVLPIRPVVLGTVYDPTFGDDDAADGLIRSDRPKSRANFDRMNATLAAIAPRYGVLADIHAHFRTGRPDWFTQMIEPSLVGASEVRRCFLRAIENGGLL